jgi:hypothetical protein
LLSKELKAINSLIEDLEFKLDNCFTYDDTDLIAALKRRNRIEAQIESFEVWKKFTNSILV